MKISISLILDTLASWNDDPSHPPKCTGGYAYNWLNLRREVEERVTYSVCPITGSNAESKLLSLCFG